MRKEILGLVLTTFGKREKPCMYVPWDAFFLLFFLVVAKIIKFVPQVIAHQP